MANVKAVQALACLSLGFAVWGALSCGGGSSQTCAAGTQCVCTTDCTFECAGRDCDFECKQPGISCEFRCPGGGCEASCQDAAFCSMACPGNNCDVDCNGTDCRITECSSNCQLDCDGSNICESSCTEPSRACQTDRD